MKKSALPQSEAELLERCQAIEGLSLAHLASRLNVSIPPEPVKRKGWIGQVIELALGASAGNHAVPDFTHLGIELKTLPINASGSPAESTFVTSIPLLTIHKQTWKTSQCFNKLKRVLWQTIEDDPRIPFIHRRIGCGFLWSPSKEEESILAKDWMELSFMIGSGKLAAINGSLGEYLHVRPKAANAKSLCYGYDEIGEKILTLPRGFYLRSCFTKMIYQRSIEQP